MAIPLNLGDPGRMIKRFDPSAANCARMAVLAPSPSASMAITAATPMRIPRIDNTERILWEIIAEAAWRK